MHVIVHDAVFAEALTAPARSASPPVMVKPSSVTSALLMVTTGSPHCVAGVPAVNTGLLRDGVQVRPSVDSA